MLTLYHAPLTRSTRVVQLIAEMRIEDSVEVRLTDIPRIDGSGARDPANPHPEGKVPFLVHGSVGIRETNAILLYLTDLYPETPLGRPVGHPGRGSYLSWLFWYGNVMEPVYLAERLGLSDPAIARTWRGTDEAAATLGAALAQHPYLVDEMFSAADLLIASTYGWFRDLIPDDPAVRAWVDRCLDRPALTGVLERDRAAMADRTERAPA
ncbi:glutathione S-transferase [Rhodovulum sulfidophilum]|uniref:Glutathione S-transferase C-terminal domain-containing protein n=1 Tax=Rhodovulum visakhapatnamense TaxID=364297 RepID=A0ABS1RLY2_9RHOB|nr:glutathione S-transferase N-terminal domain-containing protein [Rhodovulum visakhapatnamense]MBL3568741.1 glutathione S-transferase C-terminal domain-containing protein [Rhodovulum visakhapatnamense]MBL3580660.1 glutathione S-transferase C-terminal domain-containing protein [Rhodovulum visakhapatnamense]OLS44934.1 glutathione S-transferase [Rhodovulum sulfidophilum]